jgi:opacity protein-like surface antigen
MLKTFRITIIAVFCTIALSAEVGNSAPKPSGQFELGARTSASLFSSSDSGGFGTGGQFRIRILESLNTEWFADYLTGAATELGYREDAHIGWSVMFYPFASPYAPGKFTPYLLAGHCFDYTRVARYSDNTGTDRFSSAIQAGMGTHYHIDDRFNISLSGQYMLHLGSDIHTSVSNQVLTITKANAAFEGHLLFTFSLNYRVGNLW